MAVLKRCYHSINPNQICFFALSNVGEHGYRFLICPERVALDCISSRLVGNDAAHHSRPGHTYCRVFCPTLGQMCWTLSIVTSTGESLGRKGIVYCFGACSTLRYLYGTAVRCYLCCTPLRFKSINVLKPGKTWFVWLMTWQVRCAIPMMQWPPRERQRYCQGSFP